MHAILISILSTCVLFGQNNRISYRFYQFKKISKFTFDKSIQDYVKQHTIVSDGSIRINSKEIKIYEYNGKTDEQFEIFKPKKYTKGSQEVFLCKAGMKKIAITISSNKKYLSYIMGKHKFIYELYEAIPNEVMTEIIEIPDTFQYDLDFQIVE